jgi:serine/threonine protein kinase/ketosteroid isomerase-like protein
MCEVYRARHIAIDKEVAIKILKPELAADPKVAMRFEQEARAASRVRHPHAINVTDYGIGENNTPFLVMELVEGQTVRELLREQGPMRIERVANIIHQACGALEVAHSVGVIHRDIKPDNIIISEYDGGDWVEVVDFGVAKIQEDVNRHSALTGANFIIGTPRYMSPEQCEEKPVDARSDIYSLGVVVYEMLTGDAPFDAASSTRLFMAHIAEPPPPIREKRPDLSPDIEAVVMRALEKNPERRPQSALEFAREFEQAAGLYDYGRASGGRSGAISRISVPLDESPIPANVMAEPADVDEEETLVRRRGTTPARRVRHTDTLEDLDERNPYSTVADAPGPGAPHTIDGPTGRISVHPNESTLSDETEVSRQDLKGRKAKSNLPLIIGLFLLSAVIGFIAFMVLGNRSGSNNAPASQPPSSQSAREDGNAAAAGNANVSQPNAAQPTGQPDNNAATPGTVAPAPEAGAPASNEVSPPGEPTEETTQVDTGKVKKQVTAVIDAWTKSFESKNLNAHMRYYAPTLHTYFLDRNVDRSFARKTVADYLARYSKLSFNVSPVEVRVESSGERAIATFNKSWNFEGAPPSSGTTLERVWLRKAGNRWVITGVRDLR